MIISHNIQQKINCYLIIILSVFYFSQKAIFPSNDIIGGIILFIILLISFYYLLKVIQNKKLFHGLVKILFLFLVVNILYFIFSSESYNEIDIDKLKTILLNFLPFFPIYYFAMKGIITKKELLLFFFLSLPLFILMFQLSTISIQSFRNREDVVNNTIYLFIGLLPFVFLFRNKIISFSALILIWTYIVQGNKRSAFLCGILAILLFVYQTIYASKFKYKIQTYFVAIVLTLGLSYFAYNSYLQNEYLGNRVELMMNGDSSGRDVQIENYFNGWYNSNSLFDYFFGLGYNSSYEFTSSASHNDWMDLLGSYGLIGFSFYLLLWFYLVRELKNGRWDKNKKLIMILYLGISFISSLFFRWYASPFPYMNYLILPYLVATKEKEL